MSNDMLDFKSCCSACMPKIKAVYDSATKKIVSMRDGYQEYYGSELGDDYEASKLYKVYRSPETIKEAVIKLKDIDITNEHVQDFDSDFSDQKIGKVKTSEVKDEDGESDSTIHVVNDIDYSEDFMKLVDDGKKEFSLGYTCDYIKPSSDKYDLEQVNINPHHLALVSQGRCGTACKILDNKFDKIDNESLINQNDGDKTMDVEELIKAVIEMSEEDKQKVKDACFGDEEKKEPMNVKDSVEFKVALDEAIAEKEEELKSKMKDSENIKEKAKEFLDEDYDYADKEDMEIMKDALSTQYDEELSEEEIPVAFKLLKKTMSKEVKDSIDVWADVANKEF